MKATGSYLLMLQKYINWKQKNAEIKDYAVCLGNVSKDFIINNTKKNKIKRLFVNFNPIDTKDILDNHNCLMKKHIK